MSEVLNREKYRERTAETLVLRQVTKDRYHEMLEILPPVKWTEKGFLVGEPTSHTAQGFATFAPFFTINDALFYEGDGPITRRTFSDITRAQIEAAIERGNQ